MATINSNNAENLRKEADEIAAKLEKGTLKLHTPIKGGGKELTEIGYDFTALTGWEYAEALDADANATNAFRLTRKQAVSLFAAAVAKETPELDAKDVKERLSAKDAVQAVNLATIFFVNSGREAR